MKNRTLLLSTSRLHRPFAKRLEGKVLVNENSMIELVYPKVGYFHTAAEVLQIVRYLKGAEAFPSDLMKYVFRVEPRNTTPFNEFDEDLERAIRAGEDYRLPFNMGDIDTLIFEVSSLSVNLHVSSGCVLHSNPNIQRNVPYSEIYPEGYYKKFENSMLVDRMETDHEEMIDQFKLLKEMLPGKRIIVMAHLRSQKYPNSLRDRIHQVVNQSCREVGFTYLDVGGVLDTYGFGVVNGVRDMHHLSHAGEDHLAELMFNTVI